MKNKFEEVDKSGSASSIINSICL